jgi:hypothetical protein
MFCNYLKSFALIGLRKTTCQSIICYQSNTTNLSFKDFSNVKKTNLFARYLSKRF